MRKCSSNLLGMPIAYSETDSSRKAVMNVLKMATEQIQGKKILVTGGTGTIGKELIRRILPLGPDTIRIFSRDENKQYHMRESLRAFPNVRFLLGDVRDRDRLKFAFEEVDTVFHLAALKHVESCEYNPFEAIRTNIQGTQNVIDCALETGVGKVIFSSTDKSVNPTNAMGASKLMAEKLIVAANYYKGRHETLFSSVRFGNVLASSGSVIPTFVDRIRRGRPINVTDFNMSRFITTYGEAVELLLTAAAQGVGGEIFIRKMPVINIRDLAEALNRHVSCEQGQSPVAIREVGARAGEKLYEEIVTEEESSRAFWRGNYLIVKPLIGGGQIADDTLRPFRKGPYTSRDEPVLSQDEILALLHRERLLEKRSVFEKDDSPFSFSKIAIGAS